MNDTAEQPCRRANSEGLRLAREKDLRYVRHLFERIDYAKLVSRTIADPRKRLPNDSANEHPVSRLFFRSHTVSERDLRRVVSFAELRALITSNLLDLSNCRAVALVKVMPYENLLLTSDTENRRRINEPDFVMGISASTMRLAALTVRRRARRTLDICTGSGIQAMLASRHSEHVTATDLCPRALDFAHFNTRLNRITNVTLLEGDLFQPAEGQRFDLIVCNPPYVISPERRCLYRDNPMKGDELLEHLVRKMARFLNVDGYGQLVGDWTEHEGRDWRRRLFEWFNTSDCDAWAIRVEAASPGRYAATWLKAYKPAFPAAEHARWMQYFDELGIKTIHTGLITLRRTVATEHWYRTSEAPRRLKRGCGEDVLRGFEGQDFLATIDATAHLLDTRLELSGDVRMNQAAERIRSGWEFAKTRLSRTRGLSHSIDLAPGMASLLMRLRDGSSLRDVLTSEELANPGEVATYSSGVRKLVSQGFLIPQHNHQNTLDRHVDEAHWTTASHSAEVHSTGANP